MDSKNTSSSIVRGTAIVSALTLVSRIVGFLRDMIIARLFGAADTADAFIAAFRIPNLLRSLLAEGAMTSAFVPVFASDLKENRAKAQETLSAVLSLLLAASLILSALGIIFADQVVAIIAAGFGADTDKGRLCVGLTQVMLPYIAFVSVVSLLNGALNSVKIFGVAASAQVTMNVVLIIGALVAEQFSETEAAFVLAWFVLFGGLAQVLIQIPSLKRAQFKIVPSRTVWTKSTRQIARLMLPAILAASTYQIAFMISQMLASMLEPGSVSWLFYADRLSQLPIGLFTVALASVLLPSLAMAAAHDDQKSFDKGTIDALRYTSFLMIPAATGLFVFAHPIIEVAFERGKFGHYDTGKTAIALQIMSIGLWSTSCVSMLARAFIAKKDTLTPSLVGIISLLVSVISSLLLMGSPQGQTDESLVKMTLGIQNLLGSIVPLKDFGHLGLAFATAAGSMASMLALCMLLGKRNPTLQWRPMIGATARALLASVVMAVSLKFALTPISSPLFQLLIGIPSGLILYIFFSRVLKSPESQETFGIAKRLVQKLRR